MAQRTKASFKSTKNTRFADSTTGEISAQDSRDMYEDVADSFLSIDDNFIDEDSFASDSATKAPSQQSVKTYIATQISSSAVPNTDVEYFERGDWVAGGINGVDIIENGWVHFYAGSGAGRGFGNYGVNTTENVLGEIAIETGIATTGFSLITKNTSAINFTNGFTQKLRYRTALETLSDGTNTYTVYMGFGDGLTGSESSDGAYFRYTHSVNSARWEAVCSAGGVRTAADTGVLAEITTYHIFEIRVNSDGTSVTFYIDGSLVATIATNIPGSGSYCGLSFRITKSAGTTTRNVHMDWYDYLITRTTAR